MLGLTDGILYRSIHRLLVRYYLSVFEASSDLLGTPRTYVGIVLSDYESAYKKVESVQEKSESLKIGWRTFIFGGPDQKNPASEISQYSPARARMTLAFNDYVFTTDEAKSFYKEQLGL